MNRKNRRQNGMNCMECPVRSLCLPGQLDENQLSIFNGLVSLVQLYKPGEHLYHINEKNRYIYAVYDGACKDYWINYEGDEIVKEFYLPGDILGLEYLHGSKTEFSAVALRKTTICMIPIDGLLELANQDPVVEKQLFKLFCKKIYNSNQFHLTTSARKRVASFYINYISRMLERTNIRKIPLYMSQIDISNKLGLANETFNRILHTFMKAGLLDIKKNHILKYDLRGLEAIAP